jgi:imidazole glycerol-phosphate synthase subunit HisF
MLRPRVIPTLLLSGQGLVKGVHFEEYKYVGDPINAVKIFNDKEVDELLFLDITATAEKRPPSLQLVEKLADECYMPFGVGGGIRSVKEIQALLSAGAEKVVINTSAVQTPGLIREAADTFGSQSVVVSIDVKRSWLRSHRVVTHSGRRATELEPVAWARQAEGLGAGEILLNSVDRDGTMQGYDLELVKAVSTVVNIPVIACGGAGKLEHMAQAIGEARAAAVAAGSLFVFYGPKRAVLINFPNAREVEAVLAGPS